MASIPDIILYGPDASERGGVVSFNIPHLHPHDIGTVLDRHGVAIRSGHHCTQPLMRCLGISGTARASFYVYNTPEEVDALVEAVKAAREYFLK
jgi:cysteine desulfurase/selenocysteine lyase